jgi:hypothetical protein
MKRLPYHSRRMNTAVTMPWTLLLDLELEAQARGVTRSQLVCEAVALLLGAEVPPPRMTPRSRPQRPGPRPRPRRHRYIPAELREASAPWLREPKGGAAEPFVEPEDNPRRPLVRQPADLGALEG